MNTCSALNLNGCIASLQQAFGNYFGWVQYWPWIVGTVFVLVALYALNQVKNFAGWPGVTAVVVAIVAVWENVRGRQGKGVLPFKIEPDTPDIPPKDAQLPPALPPVPRPRPNSGTLFGNLFGKK